MADDVVLNPGTGGDVVAADEISGKKYQRVKLQYGPNGTATPVSTTAPLPVTVDAGTLMQRIEMLEMILSQLLHGAGGQSPTTSGQTRVSVEAGTMSSVTNVGSVTSITNPVALSGQMNNLPALMLRDRITTT